MLSGIEKEKKKTRYSFKPLFYSVALLSLIAVYLIFDKAAFISYSFGLLISSMSITTIEIAACFLFSKESVSENFPSVLIFMMILKLIGIGFLLFLLITLKINNFVLLMISLLVLPFSIFLMSSVEIISEAMYKRKL